MNDYQGERRKRGQNLLVVEGNHEKNKLFWLIFRCFPEININMDEIWIYGTNIYQLYEDIVKEYGENGQKGMKILIYLLLLVKRNIPKIFDIRKTSRILF